MRGPRSPTPLLLTIHKPGSTMGLVTTSEIMNSLQAAANEVASRYVGLQGAIEVRNRTILVAAAADVPQADIAKAAGLSQQRISQLIYDAEDQDNGQPH